MFKYHDTMKQGFAKVPDALYNEENLTLEMAGAMGFIIHCDPDTWDLTPKSMATIMCCGEDHARKVFNQLEASGHLKRTDVRDKNGYKLKSTYEVFADSTGIDYYYQRTGRKLYDKDKKYAIYVDKHKKLEAIKGSKIN